MQKMAKSETAAFPAMALRCYPNSEGYIVTSVDETEKQSLSSIPLESQQVGWERSHNRNRNERSSCLSETSDRRRCTCRSTSRNRHRSRSLSRNRSNSRHRSRSRYRSGYRNRSRSRNRSGHGSRSGHRSRSRNRSGYRSRSGHRSRSRNRSGHRSRSRNRSWSRLSQTAHSPPSQSQPVPSPLLQGLEEMSPNQTQTISTRIVDELTPFFTRMEFSLEEVTQRLTTLDSRVRCLEDILRTAGRDSSGCIVSPLLLPSPALPHRMYPIKTTEDLKLFEEELGNPSVRENAVRFLAAIGGSDLREVIGKMWKWLLCPRLAFSYTLTGKVKEKGRLRDFPNILNTVYEATRQRYPAATLTELDGFTGHNLTRSCDRGGQKQEREQKKQLEREMKEKEKTSVS